VDNAGGRVRVPGTGAADYIARWRPSSAPPEAASFARAVVARAAPPTSERAKNLLWAAGRLAGYGISLGLEPVPEVLLRPSVTERFTTCAPGLSGSARRTLRTNLRSLARAVAPALAPADAPLPRERAKAPYSPAEADGYLALAGAQPTAARRMRAAGLICLGAGAGLTGADLRQARGSDVACRSGGVVVQVRGRRPRAVPVLTRYHEPLLAAAASAGNRLVTGGQDPSPRNVTTPLVSALAGGTGLPRPVPPAAGHLAGRLRAAPRAGHVHAGGRHHLLTAPRRHHRHARPRRRGRGGRPARSREVNGQMPLAALEDITGRASVAARIEMLLPVGVRRRQLKVRTLLTGMLLTQADHRPAHLTRVHEALTGLPADDQARLGVIAEWRTGPHQLTYRQAERTLGLVTDALAKDESDGVPSCLLAGILDDLLEASIPAEDKDTARALAVDWTDLETFSRPPRHGTTGCADPEAAWGHRNSNLPRPKGEMFFGYYLSAATMTREEHGPAVPEMARRMTLSSCHTDPARAIVPVLRAMPGHGVPLGDILADSGYAHRDADAWAIPLRQAGAQLVQDLHPHDRGPQGTHAGAVISNGTLYCPATPRPLLELGPLARDATGEDIASHDGQTAELARYKLGKITADDADGYHRVMCPAVMGKIRCPLRPGSMTLDRSRPEILTPPEHPPACCSQQTITIPPAIAAKTRQKHDYPSREHRRSFARRTGAERTFSTAKDPASNNISRGWCRLMGLTPLALFTSCLLIVRNQRILAAWEARQAQNARRATAGLPPKTRQRHRKTLASLAAAPP
jgi:integrase